MSRTSSFLIVSAGLFGACGIAGAAAAAHGGDTRQVAIAAAIALVQAPSLLALAGLAPERLRFRALSGALLVLGTLLFSGDLAMRQFTGERLFAMAAPAGGVLMMAGWLVVVCGALAALGRRNSV